MKRNTRLWIWAVVVLIIALLWWWKCVDHTISNDPNPEVRDTESTSAEASGFTLYYS